MTAADVPVVLDIQEPGAVLGLADVFPQDAYPFPRDVVAQRWLQEIATPGIDCYVVVLDGAVVGFAAIRDDEFLHFGTAIEHWGTGVAETAHDAVLDVMASRGSPAGVVARLHRERTRPTVLREARLAADR